MTYVLVVLAAAVVLTVAGLRLVGPDERLVVRRLGRHVRTAGPGPAFVVPLLETGSRVDTEPRHLWAVATATTRDGVTAHVRVEFTLRVTDLEGMPDDVAVETMDAVEEVLRHQIAAHMVAELPVVGDDPGWEPDAFLPGVLVQRAVVTVSDVAVGSELRRLVGGASGP